MSNAAQKRALRNYRHRLSKRGMARFEVLGLDKDRELIRSPAKRLAQDDANAARIRVSISRSVSEEPRRKGGILKALRRSPLVGADLIRSEAPARSRAQGRAVMRYLLDTNIISDVTRLRPSEALIF